MPKNLPQTEVNAHIFVRRQCQANLAAMLLVWWCLLKKLSEMSFWTSQFHKVQIALIDVFVLYLCICFSFTYVQCCLCPDLLMGSGPVGWSPNWCYTKSHAAHSVWTGISPILFFASTNCATGYIFWVNIWVIVWELRDGFAIWLKNNVYLLLVVFCFWWT